jgi:hypothetical protein
VASMISFKLSSKAASLLFIVFLRFDVGTLNWVGEWDLETRGLELSCLEAADVCLGRLDNFLRGCQRVKYTRYMGMHSLEQLNV